MVIERFRLDQTVSVGLSSAARAGSEQPAHLGGFVLGQAVPEQQDRSAELLVGGLEQGGEVFLGEAFRFAFAPGVLQDPVVQAGSVAGAVAGQAGKREFAGDRLTVTVQDVDLPDRGLLVLAAADLRVEPGSGNAAIRASTPMG